MGFGTNNQLGNRTGVTNQTSLADLFGGMTNSPQQSQGFGGGAGGGQNQLFSLLQQLLGGGGGFQAGPGTPGLGGSGFNRPGDGLNPPPPGMLPPIGGGGDFGMQPPVGTLPDLGGLGLGGSTSPVIGNLVGGGNFSPRPPDLGGGLSFGRPGDNSIMPIGGTPMTSLSNPFAQLINKQAIR